jgi:hypothetical protein
MPPSHCCPFTEAVAVSFPHQLPSTNLRKKVQISRSLGHVEAQESPAPDGTVTVQRRMRTCFALLIFVSSALPAIARSVVDGDTLYVGRLNYRLFGIDAPERNDAGYREAAHLRRVVELAKRLFHPLWPLVVDVCPQPAYFGQVNFRGTTCSQRPGTLNCDLGDEMLSI